MKKLWIVLFGLLSFNHLALAEDVSTRVSASICRPEFIHGDGGKHKAGTAFLLNYNNQQLLLTAFHLFGPSGGLLKQIGARELPLFIKEINCTQITDKGDQAPYRSSQAVVIPNATPLGQSFGYLPTLDISIFRANSPSPNFLKLAENDVKVGDDVWLVAETKGERYKGIYFHHAKVTSIENNSILNFKYDDPTIQLRASSGAPVINAKGDLVGVNAGHYNDLRDTYGISSTLSATKQALLNVK